MTTPLSEELREKIASSLRQVFDTSFYYSPGSISELVIDKPAVADYIDECTASVLSLLPVGWEGDSSSCSKSAASVASQPDCSTAQSFDGGVLKPCPFCGGTRIGGPYRDDREGLFYVACISKPGRSCGETFAATEAEALTRWSRRRPPEGADGEGGARMTVYRPRRLPHAILSTLEAEPMFLGDLQAQVPSDLPHRKLGRKVYLTLGALMRDGFVRATVDGYSLTDDGRDALRDLRAGMTVTTDAPVTSVRVFVDRRAAA